MANQQYFATYVQDLEQDPFDPTDFVERLAWRLTGGGGDDIQATSLHRAFEEEIGSLQLLSEQYQSKIQRLEGQCREEEEEFAVTLDRLQAENAGAVDKLKDLDATMQLVAGKVVHLGDQLESVNAPRARAFEALQLMKHFDEFLTDQPLHSDVFTDPDKLLESAEIIHKLASISQELSSDKYATVQSRINHKYDEIERLMLEEFVRTHRVGNRQKMKQIATILSNFKGYSQCLDAYIEHIQVGAFRSADIFGDTLSLCRKTYPMLDQIFPTPEQVMAKLALNIFHGKLQEFIGAKLMDAENDGDLESYLTNLHDLYAKTQKLAVELAEFKIGSDAEFLPALIRSLFGRYLDTYIQTEIKFLNEQCTNLLQKFYESKKHQKRQIQSGGLQDFKRDIQARIMTVETFGGETFLSEEVAINMLQETKLAFQRCQSLSVRDTSPQNTELVLDVLLKYLCTEHLEYAIEIGLSGISLAEPKTPPPPHFLSVVRQTAAICHLFEKQFEDSIYALVKETTAEESAVSKKRQALFVLENKMTLGLDRHLNAVVGYVRFVLATEQKKTDFRPENEDQIVPLCSTACTTVVRFLNEQVERIRDSVDGTNLTTVMTELGVRFHRTVLTHIYQFVYSSAGAMLLLCDINEYRKLIMSWKVPLASKLFESLHALSNLLVVVPENLADACTADVLGDVDRTIVVNFVQLRADYRSARLYNDFR
uniref:Exocyst complex component 5 n=1 Tax=Plectus sambesii TaxID=2011161 RepID=A0A914W432_9BILA